MSSDQNSFLHGNSTPVSRSSSPQNPTEKSQNSHTSLINFTILWSFFKNWIKRPKHIALFVWALFIASGFITLALLMTGLLNKDIPSSSRRNNWKEVINQILNALFTVMSLYEHPKFVYQLFLLLRWTKNDEIELRKIYFKNGDSKWSEWKHMMTVVILLHITCFSQYVLCGLYWFCTSTTRPSWALKVSIAVGSVATIIVLFYTISDILSGVKVEAEERRKHEDFCEKGIFVENPRWIGGLFDCRDELAVTCLSFCCTFCVFGWNMERLGFGNKYVHMITFLVICTSPLIVFFFTAKHVNGAKLKLVLVIIGSIHCFVGLLYGGFWRTKMRKKFHLSETSSIFNTSSTVSDYLHWLFCWSCSLAQEVRTASFYDIEEDGFYQKLVKEGGWPEPIPLESRDESFMKNYQRIYSNHGSVGLSVAVMEPPISPVIGAEEGMFVTVEL